MKKFLKFWGTRGSCSVSGPEYAEFGGNSCCLEVGYEDVKIIIDAGTGIRPLGETLPQEKKIDIFLSHTHWDHLIGFPFFEPLYNKEAQITIWSPRGSGRSIEELFDDLLSQEFFPVHLEQVLASLKFRTIEEGKTIKIGALTFDFHKTRHPGPTFCFKIKTPHETISYVTDNEIDVKSQQSFIDFHRNVDLFIHEAQYTQEEYKHKNGWGHSPLDRAIALVNQVRPGRWLVTHHDPKHSDADLRALEKMAHSSSLPCSAEWIPDGRVWELK